MAIQSVHAGHGGKKNGSTWTDPGAVGSGYTEADVARKIAALIAKKTGVRDVTDNSSTNSTAIINNVAARLNTCPDGWQISVHLNAFNGSATGVEVLYGSSDSKVTAAKVSAAIAKVLGLTDRGAKDGSWLGIARLSGSGKKVLLIEFGFIDNKKDMDALMSKMDAAVDAMLAVFGYSTTAKPSTPTQPTAPKNPFANIVVDSNWDTNLNKYLQQYYKLPIKDGLISGQIKGTWNAGITGIEFGAGGSNLVAAIQKDVGVPVDRNMGPGTIKAMQKKAGTEPDESITRPSALAKKIKENLKYKGKPW